MRLLLDTHAFIWWSSEPDKLSRYALSLCQDRTNILMLSIATVWEIQIKMQLGKLRLARPLAETIKNQQQINNVALLSVELAHVLALGSLPAAHKDPFDRLLIAQALVERASLVSSDPMFARYPVQVLW